MSSKVVLTAKPLLDETELRRLAVETSTDLARERRLERIAAQCDRSPLEAHLEPPRTTTDVARQP